MSAQPAARTILIADDEAHIVYILEGNLSDAGFDVVVARDGAEALALALEHRPVLAITDLNMPGTDGLEFAVALRENPLTAETPVIMLTGRGHTVPDDALTRTNIRHLESKPFSARLLLGTVRALLGSAAEAA